MGRICELTVREKFARALERYSASATVAQKALTQAGDRRTFQHESWKILVIRKKKAWGVLRSQAMVSPFRGQSEGDASGELEIARCVDGIRRNAELQIAWCCVDLTEGMAVEGVQGLGLEDEIQSLMNWEALD